MQTNLPSLPQRKIIHIDMDCFYAAIEIRDNSQLADLPVAVGGSATARGVLCTCNYIARKFGVRSAMPTATALNLCPHLILLPVNMQKYKQVSKRIQNIFRQYSDMVEPLALDEAFIDVTFCTLFQGSATLIAADIRQKIWESEHLTASAGVSCNKFLAKIASGWKKPNGMFVIRPDEVQKFVAELPVKHLFGVGKVTASKMLQLGIHTCTDLQGYTLPELVRLFGKLGIQLYYQSRGIDYRKVEANRVRKSLSVETTFAQNISHNEDIHNHLHQLSQTLVQRLAAANLNLPIKAQFIKVKFADFKQISAEISTNYLNPAIFIDLFNTRCRINSGQAIRLLGVGVTFNTQDQSAQPELFGQQ